MAPLGLRTDWEKGFCLALDTVLLLIITGSFDAASFDCGKATTKVEKIICSDDELSKLDESLNKAYLQALKRSDI